MQRLFALALNKVRATGEFTERVISSMLDAIMGTAIDILNTHKGITLSLSEKTIS